MYEEDAVQLHRGAVPHDFSTSKHNDVVGRERDESSVQRRHGRLTLGEAEFFR